MTAVSAPRHPWCRDFCAYLDRAARIPALARLRPADGPGTLVLLPAFTWLPPAITVGRKTRNPDGPDYTLPVRLTYDVGEAVILRPGETAEIRVRARGMGHDLAGTVAVTSAAGLPADETTVSYSGSGLPAAVGAGTAVSLPRAVAQAREDASLARWEAAMVFLQPSVERETDRAISVLRSSSAGSGSVAGAVRDAVIDKIVFGIAPARGGEDDAPADPPLLRLVDRCCEPDAFLRADPARIVALTVRRDARDAAQSVTGDTRLGVRLRGLADQLGPGVTPSGLAEAANRRSLSAMTITEGRARLALGYVMPSEVSLPPSVTGIHEAGRS